MLIFVQNTWGILNTSTSHHNITAIIHNAITMIRNRNKKRGKDDKDRRLASKARRGESPLLSILN
jgi:hypothetical protein